MTPTYEVVAATPTGKARVYAYATDEPLRPGDVLRLDGRDWLIETVEPSQRAAARPARYRLRLRNPDGTEEVGAFRRFRPDGPKFGHAFTTVLDGRVVGWQVVDEQLARDEGGEPYLDLRAERDFSELDEPPDHELEHTLAAEDAGRAAAVAAVARAEAAGLAVEIVALEPGEEPDWDEARRYVDALVLEMIEDDLLELCGVDPRSHPREAWLGTVQERLRADLERFRADVERDHDQIEEWDFRDGRVFASVGSVDDEADPDSGHGWLCRLVDAGPLTAAGFARVRKAELAGAS